MFRASNRTASDKNEINRLKEDDYIDPAETIQNEKEASEGPGSRGGPASLLIPTRRYRRIRSFGWSLVFAAAFIIPVLMASPVITTYRTFYNLGHPKQKSIFPALFYWPDWISKIADERWLISFGKPAGMTDVEWQKSIVDRRPENPIYYGNYIVSLLNSMKETNDLSSLFKDKDGSIKVLAALDRGERIDPRNAFYNFMKAVILIQSASQTMEDPTFTYEWTDHRGKKRIDKGYSLIIHDPRNFDRGLKEFERGLTKPFYNSHSVDRVRITLEFLGPITSMNEYINQTGLTIGVCLPDLGPLRQMARSISGYARQQAKRGDAKDAIRSILGVRLMGTMLGEQGKTPIDILVAYAISAVGMENAMDVYHKLGLETQARLARKQLEEDNRFFHSLYSKNTTSNYTLQKELIRNGSVIHKVLVPAIPEYRVDLEALRKGEYAVAEKGGLTVLMMILSGFILVIYANLLYTAVWDPAASKEPPVFFVGVGDLIRIIFIAFILPIGLYILYAHLTNLGERNYGFLFAIDRILLEFFFFGLSIIFLFLYQSYTIIQKRAREAGLAVPVSPFLRFHRVFVFLAVILGVGFGIYLYAWHCIAMNLDKGAPFDLLILPLLILLEAAFTLFFIWLNYENTRLIRLMPEYAPFRRVLYRSMIRILALSIILVGSLGSFALSKYEASVMLKSELPLDTEVRDSGYKRLQDRMARQYERLLDEYRRLPTGL